MMRRYARSHFQPEVVSDNSDTDNRVSFELKTQSGKLVYRPTDSQLYTDFLRVIFELMLAFNTDEIDPIFRSGVRKVLKAYEGNDWGVFEGAEDDDEYDGRHGFSHVEDAIEEAKKLETANFVANNLPEVDTLTIKILSSDESDSDKISSAIEKETDFPPNQVHKIVNEHKPFNLAFEKAKKLYVSLRMLGVMLTIHPTLQTEVAANKKTAKKQAARSYRKTKRKKRMPVITGNERLNIDDAIISKQ